MIALSKINFRDLGGIAMRGGRKLKAHRLYRSEGPASFGGAQHAALSPLGIRVICDLRSASERAAAPHAWAHGAKLLEIDVVADLRHEDAQGWEALKAEPTAAAARRAMQLNYAGMPAAMKPHLGRLAQSILDRDMPLLVHCTAGKDRTGVLIALLLSALGTDRAEIDADYLLSRGRRRSVERDRSVSEQFEAMIGFAPDRAVMDAIMTVDTAFLDAAFEAVIGEWGSVERYFADAGVEHDKIEAMREILAE